MEYEVCVCVSPKYGRVGKLRPAYGEYGGLAGNAFSADSWSSVPMSVVTSCAATAVANRPATRALASAALGPMMSRLFISFSSWPRKSVPARGRRLSHRITPQSIGTGIKAQAGDHADAFA